MSTILQRRVLGLGLSAILGAGLVAGCGEGGQPWGEEVRSDKQRITNPAVSPAEQAQLSAGNTAFAFDLYRTLAASDAGKNVFCSPYSISLALAMTYGGARGNTEAEMAKTLHFGLPQERLHPAFDDLDLKLASRGQGAKDQDGGKFRLSIANSMWGIKGYPYLTPFLDVLAESYGAGLRVVDFVGDPESSRQAINQWVEQKTEEKIKELLPQGSIDDLTRLVLVNAIYFNAAWAVPFDKGATKDEAFHLADGSTVRSSMMTKVDELEYAKLADGQAVVMPYDGHQLSLVLLLPDEGKLAAMESGLSSSTLDSILQGLSGAEVTLTLPKFDFEYGTKSLKAALQALGMKDAFDEDRADLTGMFDRSQTEKPLLIKDVLHKAFVKIDEAGTEAAAATAVVIGEPTASPVQPELPNVVVKLDRPFLFLIRDDQTGAVLFVGRILNPNA